MIIKGERSGRESGSLGLADVNYYQRMEKQ